jgi:peptidoglycan hydrolase CwlO-like protein
MRARRGELDARNVELLQDQVKALEGALEYERARSDKQAEAFAGLARTCDNRVGDLEAQYKEKHFKLEALVADKDATIAEQRRTLPTMAASQAAIAVEMKKQTLELGSRYGTTAAAQAAHVTLLKEQQATLEASGAAVRDFTRRRPAAPPPPFYGRFAAAAAPVVPRGHRGVPHA